MAVGDLHLPSLVSQARAGHRGRAGVAWLGAVVLLGALLRFPTLGLQSFWYDESFTHNDVLGGFGHLLFALPLNESTPPLYYVLAWVWTRATGTGAVGLRSLSAVFGTLTIPVMWELGRRCVSERAGLIAALLTAVNPLMFWYSQEARAYQLLTLTSALTILALLRALEQPGRRRLLVWGLACCAALATHYFALLLILPEGAYLLVSLRHRLTPRHGIAMLAPVALLGGALIVLIVRQNSPSVVDGRHFASVISHTRNYLQKDGSLPFRLLALAKQDVVGFIAGPAQAAVSLAGLALAAAALAGLASDSSSRARARLPLVLGVAPIALAVLAAVAGYDFVNTRNLLVSWPALALLVALGLDAIPSRRIAALTAGGLLALGIGCILATDLDVHLQRDDWRGAARALGAATAPRVIVSNGMALYALQAYAPGLTYLQPRLPVREIDLLLIDDGLLATTPPRLARLTPPAGFVVVGRVRTATYTLIRLRSPAPRTEPKQRLVALYPRRHGFTFTQVPTGS